ncbi:MAG: hypothetical protein EBU06_00735 [Micrococcales bacterium]|nr:hypothetical protein [Micrococcales bacterium]NBR60448.1 hypothetical protein [Actinomycetota bacterium]NBY44130.1 hypothetical protein [Micrococcales bacterium]NDE88726.1 hypothetical protein [Micrococcales bacterium]
MAKNLKINVANSLPNGTSVADFNNYTQAVSFVEQVLRGDFPANAIAIVGTKLTTVERVRGKINYSRVAGNGAIIGAWFGLIFYIIFGTSAENTMQVTLIPAIIVGAGAGMLWQVIRFSVDKNKRSFSSTSQVVAAKYEVLVPSELTAAVQEAFMRGAETKS